MKVLIVDDSPTIRVALRSLVEKMGHSVIEAEDGSRALEIYRQDRPDVVLIDVVMPVMDGYDAAREMRRIRVDEWVPIIFLSSKEADQDLDRAIGHAAGHLRAIVLAHGGQHAVEAFQGPR